MALKHRYKWMEIRHKEIYEPDPIHGDHGSQFLNGGLDGEGYYSRGEAIMDLERIDNIYPNRKEEYILIEFWTKGVSE